MKRITSHGIIAILGLGIGGVGGYLVGRQDHQSERAEDQRLARKIVLDSMFVVGAPKDVFEEFCVQSGVTEVTPGQQRFFYILKDNGDLSELREGDVIGFNVEFDAEDRAVVVDRAHHVHAQAGANE